MMADDVIHVDVDGPVGNNRHCHFDPMIGYIALLMTELFLLLLVVVNAIGDDDVGCINIGDNTEGEGFGSNNIESNDVGDDIRDDDIAATAAIDEVCCWCCCC